MVKCRIPSSASPVYVLHVTTFRQSTKHRCRPPSRVAPHLPPPPTGRKLVGVNTAYWRRKKGCMWPSSSPRAVTITRRHYTATLSPSRVATPARSPACLRHAATSYHAQHLHYYSMSETTDTELITTKHTIPDYHNVTGREAGYIVSPSLPSETVVSNCRWQAVCGVGQAVAGR